MPKTIAPQVAHLATFLRAKRAEGKADATLRNYAMAIRHLGRFLDGLGVNVVTMTREVLVEYVCDLRQQYADDSLNLRLGALRVFYRWLKDMGLREDDPAPKVCRFGRVMEKPVESLTLDDVGAIIAMTQALRRERFGIHRGGFLVLFLLETGMRLGEALRLTLADVDLTENRILVTATKTHKQRIIPITPSLRPRVVEYIGRRSAHLHRKHFPDTGRLLVSEWGTALSTSNAERCCRTIFKRAGFQKRVWPHMLRHSWARLSIASGKAPLPAIMAAGGWTRLDMVMRYTRLSVDQIAEVQAVSSPLTQMADRFAIPEDSGQATEGLNPAP